MWRRIACALWGHRSEKVYITKEVMVCQCQRCEILLAVPSLDVLMAIEQRKYGEVHPWMQNRMETYVSQHTAKENQDD
jgi:hypothetical protein